MHYMNIVYWSISYLSSTFSVVIDDRSIFIVHLHDR